MTQGVYEIENSLDGMAYTGGSIDIERRQQEHARMLYAGAHHCAYFQNAWNKYGEGVFVFRVVEIIEDVDMLLAAEQERMDERRAQGKSYNMALFAGAPMRGRTHTEESRCKTSESLMGHKTSDATKQKLSAAHTGKLNHNWGKHLTEGHKLKISKSLEGRKLTEDHKRRVGNAHRGRKHTEQSCRNMSKAHMGELNHNWGKHPSKETRRKRSDSMKRYWARKKARENNKQRLRGATSIWVKRHVRNLSAVGFAR